MSNEGLERKFCFEMLTIYVLPSQDIKFHNYRISPRHQMNRIPVTAFSFSNACSRWVLTLVVESSVADGAPSNELAESWCTTVRPVGKMRRSRCSNSSLRSSTRNLAKIKVWDGTGLTCGTLLMFFTCNSIISMGLIAVVSDTCTFSSYDIFWRK